MSKQAVLLPEHNFPESVITGVAGEYTNTYCNILEVPRAFMFMSFLTCLGSVLGPSLTMDTELKPQPRLYVLLLGETGDTKKSTAIDKTVDLFKYALSAESGYEDNNYKFSYCQGVGSAEGLQQTFKEKNPLLLCFDEFRSFISKARIRGSVLLECVNSLFERNSYENQTKTVPFCIEGVFFSILAASTLETYESTWDKSFTDIGFNNRIFIVPGTSYKKDSYPPKIPDKVLRALAEQLQAVLKFVGEYREIKMPQKSKDLYQSWYLSIPSSMHSKRLDGYALRVMELLAVNQFSTIINEQLVTDTIELMDWQFEMRKTYDPIDADNTLARMEEKIRRILENKGPKNGRDLKRSANGNRTGIWYYNTAIKNLVGEGEISYSRKKKEYSFTGDKV